MSIYNDFLSKLPEDNLVEVCQQISTKILEYPNIEIKKKFKLPFFYGNTWICYFNFLKTQEIEFLFVRAREFPSKELLDFKDRVMIGGLSYKSVADIDFGILNLLLEEAITLDTEKPYTFTKKKKRTS